MTKLRGCDLMEVAIAGSECAAGMTQWSPGDLKLLSPLAFEHLATFLNMVESGCDWPEQFSHARASLLSKGEEEDMDPGGYRIFLMMDSVYRL